MDIGKSTSLDKQIERMLVAELRHVYKSIDNSLYHLISKNVHVSLKPLLKWI